LVLLVLTPWLVRLHWVLTILAALFTVVGFSALFLIFRFYRDPERQIPEEPGVIVSPADGRIIYIREVRKGTIPQSIKGRSDIKLPELAKTKLLNDDNCLIGIMMTLMDVHVNRAPISGKVVQNKHFPGKFLSLKDRASLTANERNTIVFDKDGMLVGIVQIASKQVRKIVSYVSEDEDVRIGQRVGAILLGSQVDVILPKQRVTIMVKEGQQVYAGETILAKTAAANL
jgi:phosphatidylserine decarboxylase